ncbi:MAG: hypothetical protein JST29_05525 [Bacteroidetes bacterium]|nr:hypothetical protein [Bacteroidota bacterium]
MYIEKNAFNKLQNFSNRCAWYYYGKVFLIGSSLYTENFRDVDIAVVITNEDFELRFGSIKNFIEEGKGLQLPNIKNKWAIECKKRWQQAVKETGLNIDFKIIPERLFNTADKRKRLRIDLTNLYTV